jgi:hypothetical protein
MSEDTRDEKLSDLFDLTIQALIDRIKDGTAKPADLAVARGILADNKMSDNPKRRGSLLPDLYNELPFTNDPNKKGELHA